MKWKNKFQLASALLLAISFSVLLSSCKDKAAVNVTESAVDKSAYGAITIKEGYPLAKDIETIKANLQLNRASELVLWALPMNASYAIRDGVFKASGGSHLDVVYVGGFSGADKIIPTINNETLYTLVQIDLSKGPIVY